MFFSASGDDFDEAAEVFTSNYNVPSVSITPTELEFQWAHTAVGDEIMTFRKNLILARIETTFSTGDEFVVGWELSGWASYDHGRTIVDLVQSIPSILPHGDNPMHGVGEDLDQRLVHIDKSFVAGVAEELHDADFRTFAILAPALEPSRYIWRRTVDLVSVVLNDTAQPPNSLLQQEMSRLIAVTMLRTFPYTATDPTARSLGIEPTSVKVAYDFIHDNAHLPIGPVEIARAAGLSVRSLQHALRRYRETTPTALLNLARLDRAHLELAATDPGLDSVAAIARRWGFLHLGRFSATYFARFGQLPSRTLRDGHYRAPRRG